jgi:hypothetical protein
MKVFIGEKDYMTFSKDDMDQKEYEYIWNTHPGDSPNKKFMDKDLLDRTEGYEVYYFIRDRMNELGFTSTKDGQKIEKLIHHPRIKTIKERESLKDLVMLKFSED